ncbi:MAG: hypothetical protein A3E82_08735 [Gammaproteobacteria bacterium RIFCSPHIGHO2_12_FULL_38_11]|nr:MAG: hypothetical protein A3E82_08735 [Gammaproteobacteria bacterium RIFCSPHIGHO2_12_FULL_38_11]
MTQLQPRKLKINKNFKPLSKDEEDEFYPNGIFEFNITKLLMFIKANPCMFQPEEVSVRVVRTFPSSNLNESTIQTANIAEPIVLAEIAPDRFNVIDGNHRLEKAYRDGESKIHAYRVLAEQNVAFLTSVTAYESYIEYWNSKIWEMRSSGTMRAVG